MVLQNYQNLIEMTSNIIDIVAFGVGFKCPRKIHLNTQWGGGVCAPTPVVIGLKFQISILTNKKKFFLRKMLSVPCTMESSFFSQQMAP